MIRVVLTGEIATPTEASLQPDLRAAVAICYNINPSSVLDGSARP